MTAKIGKEQMRDKHLIESELQSKKQRFGLFTQPLSTAIGETSYSQKKMARRDPETGGVATGPRNFLTNPMKKGNVDKILFGKPGYITLGDPYQDPGKFRMRDNKPFKQEVHERPFRPGGSVSHKYLENEYKPEGGRPKTVYRNSEGEVLTGPRNFLNNPMKRGLGATTPGVMFTKHIHKTEPYDRARELARLERQKHYAKLQEAPFKSMSSSKGTFFPHQKTFGWKGPAPPEKVKKPMTAPIQHDRPFKPSHPPRKGYNKTLMPFPDYQPMDKHKPLICHKGIDDSQPPSWKTTHNWKTMPSPSVVSNIKNLKTDYGYLIKF